MSWYPNLTLAIIPTSEHILILFYPSPSAKSKIIPWHSHPCATFIICRRRFYSFALSLAILGLGMIMDDHSQAWNQQLVGGIPTPLKNMSQIGSSSQHIPTIEENKACSKPPLIPIKPPLIPIKSPSKPIKSLLNHIYLKPAAPSPVVFWWPNKKHQHREAVPKRGLSIATVDYPLVN